MEIEKMKEFDKVIGYSDVKIELERIIDMMINKKKYENLGVQPVKGLMLDGEPGIGKTLMAKCFIKASKRKAFTVRKNLPDDEFVKYVKSVFEKAKKEAPSIAFMDDIDKFANNDADHKDAEIFVTIQACIDEYKDFDIFVLATANTCGKLPDSLLRQGRFDKTITIESPDPKDAEKIVAHYLKKKKCAKDVDPAEIAKLLNDRTCAELETIINEAGVYAAFENRKLVSTSDLARAFMRVIYKSPERTASDNNKYTIRTAYHEAGHTAIGEILQPGSICFTTIKDYHSRIRGFAGTAHNRDYYNDVTFLENRVITLLGGKAATEVVYGTHDLGCDSDVKKAFVELLNMASRYSSYGFEKWDVNASVEPEELMNKQTTIINHELEKYYLQAKKILIENRDYLDVLANALMEKEVLLSRDIENLKPARLRTV